MIIHFSKLHDSHIRLQHFICHSLVGMPECLRCTWKGVYMHRKDSNRIIFAVCHFYSVSPTFIISATVIVVYGLFISGVP